MVAQVLIKAAITIAQIGLGMMRTTEGPRVDNRKFAGGQYNVLLPRVWGTTWVAGQYIWGQDLIEVKQRRKTKGGKFNDYSYFGSFDVVLASHEIASVRRVKADGHLIFDLSGEGPVTPFDFGGESGGKTASATGAWASSPHFAIYLGTEDQDVDDTIRADIEAKHGEGATPAYRGYPHIRFDRLPLEKFGNRIPQIEVEVQSLTNATGPVTTLTNTYQNSNLVFSHDFTTLAVGSSGGFALIDTAARAKVVETAFSPGLTYSPFALMNDGTILGVRTSLGSEVWRYQLNGTGSFYFNNNNSTAIFSVTDSNGDEHWLTKNLDDGAVCYFDGIEIDLLALTGADFNVGALFADLDGGTWVVGGENPGTTTAHFYRLSGTGAGPGYIAVTGLPSDSNSAGAVHYRDDTLDQFVFEWNGDLYAADRTSGAVLASNTTLARVPHFSSLRPGYTTAWCGLSEVSLADLTVLRTEVAGTWGLGSVGDTAYDPINHALVTGFGSSFTLRWLYLNRLGDAGVTLEDVVTDTFVLGGGDPARIDASALTQPIAGYQASAGTGRDWIEPLLDIYDVDPRPHGFLLEFLPRGGTAGAELSAADMVLDRGGDAVPLFSSAAQGGSDVPSQVVLKFADIDADGQPNSARSPRLSEIDGARELTIDLSTLVLDKDEAAQLAARYHRRRMFDARPVALGLTPAQIALEPGDVMPLDLRGFPLTARLQSVELGADRALRTEWLRDDPSVALLDATITGGAFDGRSPSEIAVALLSKGFVLDVPYPSDAAARTPPSVEILAAPLADGTWPGGVAYQSIDGEYSDEIAAVPSGESASWGYASAALPDRNPNRWDRTSSITVTLQTGTLTGCTEAELLANPLLNLAWIGGEYVQFTTATLTATRTYTVSGFLRGRRGTEWACGSHVAGEVFVLFDRAQTVSMGLSEVGTDLSFKVITSGRTSGFPIDLVPFTGASLKPYAPCHLLAVKDPATGDWTFTWVRRTRIGGAWTSGTPIPLSEASEEYQLTVGDGVSSDVKTVTSPTYLWTVAEQTTDTGAEVMAGDLEWSVAQVSDAVGAGFLAAA